MAKQTRGNNRNGRNGRRGDPNQDVQPWLGWIAAALVVVIVVVAVAMGMERTTNQRTSAAEVRMTPLVGGMELPVATEEAGDGATEVAQVTPVPEVMTETTTISDGVAMTGTDVVTDSDTFSATGEMTGTETVSATTEMSVTEGVTGDIADTAEVTATNEVTTSAEITGSDTVTGEATSEATAEPSSTPAPSPTPRATATTRPTVTPTVVAQLFEPGDTVAGSEGRVSLYADASLESMVLDSHGAGVALEVLEPGGNYTRYPVVVDGHGWARVRAADGLVGWVMTDQVEAQ